MSTARDECSFVWAHPGYQFGAICVYPTRIPVDSVAGCVWAGDSVNATADGYDIGRADVLLACWFVAMYPQTRWQQRASKKAWRQWAEDNHQTLAQWDGARTEDTPDPPDERDVR